MHKGFVSLGYTGSLLGWHEWLSFLTLGLTVFSGGISPTGHGEAAAPYRTGPPSRPPSASRGDVFRTLIQILRPAVIYNSTQKHFSLFDSGMIRKQECPPKLVVTLNDEKLLFGMGLLWSFYRKPKQQVASDHSTTLVLHECSTPNTWYLQCSARCRSEKFASIVADVQIAITFGTGYAMNCAVNSALVGEENCLMDFLDFPAQGSGATVQIFPTQQPVTAGIGEGNC
ncbi:hypothetical protein OPV22_033975 [Ensete ventricosum]|uniref:Uncharacterized protein n=1 Tax=Ensete ventricosum TaxID=4639 RepID=A0AAV8PNQ1_ENSVE|nr:hypothetical protein OPV22_033975 [Ensete ventricosum]